MGEVTNRAGRAGQQVDNSEWFDKAVKIGLVAYGIVHLLVGWLALQLAFGEREGKASSQGAMQQLAETSVGTPLLWIVGLGLFALVLWKLLDAAFGHQEEDGGKLWAKRAMDVFKAILYGAIGISAIRTATGSGGGGGGTDSTTKKIMDLPGGQILVVIVGLAVIAYGANYIRQAFNEKFREKIAATGKGDAYVYFGKAGYVAKGIAVGIIGILFAYAGVTHEAKKSGGLDQALQEVLDAPGGPVVLVLIALGIICYGLFQFARAAHHTGK